VDAVREYVAEARHHPTFELRPKDLPDAAAIWQSIAWSIGLLVLFVPLAGWAYGRRATR
jgi:hypothetical protein